MIILQLGPGSSEGPLRPQPPPAGYCACAVVSTRTGSSVANAALTRSLDRTTLWLVERRALGRASSGRRQAPRELA